MTDINTWRETAWILVMELAAGPSQSKVANEVKSVLLSASEAGELPLFDQLLLGKEIATDPAMPGPGELNAAGLIVNAAYHKAVSEGAALRALLSKIQTDIQNHER